MGFWEDVKELRRGKQIKKQWKQEDLLQFLREKYTPKDIYRRPYSYSLSRDGEPIGYEIKKNCRKSQAWRLEDGKFELIEDPQDPIEVQRSERAKADLICEQYQDQSGPKKATTLKGGVGVKLAMISPFNYGEYCNQISDFAQWMAEYVQNTPINGVVGWQAHFNNYSWDKQSWEEGVETRRNFHKTITSSLVNDQGLLGVANKIVVDWGGIKNGLYRQDEIDGIRLGLTMLHNESNPVWFSQNLDCLNFTRYSRIASHSKLYEMYDPTRWTIYDSRVSFALASIVSEYWKYKGEEVKAECLRFPLVGGRAIKNVKGFPHLYSNSTRQAALAFVYSSWLLRKVAEIMRSNPNKYGCSPTKRLQSLPSGWDDWQVYQVEMVLFMLGK